MSNPGSLTEALARLDAYVRRSTGAYSGSASSPCRPRRRPISFR